MGRQVSGSVSSRVYENMSVLSIRDVVELWQIQIDNGERGECIDQNGRREYLTGRKAIAFVSEPKQLIASGKRDGYGPLRRCELRVVHEMGLRTGSVPVWLRRRRDDFRSSPGWIAAQLGKDAVRRKRRDRHPHRIFLGVRFRYRSPFDRVKRLLELGRKPFELI